MVVSYNPERVCTASAVVDLCTLIRSFLEAFDLIRVKIALGYSTILVASLQNIV